jgi:hypothetical protein
MCTMTIVNRYSGVGILVLLLGLRPVFWVHEAFDTY